MDESTHKLDNIWSNMSALKIEHPRCSWLTLWMGVDAGIVRNWNQAQEVLTTHCLDEIWCRQCQQLKSSTRGAQDSLPGWDLMQAMLAIEIKHRRCSRLTAWMGFDASNVSNWNEAQEVLMTHVLDGIWGRQCQQLKWGTGGAHDSLPGWDLRQEMSAIEIEHRRCSRLTAWMRFDAGNVSNQNRAQEVLMTHVLDGIWGRQCQQSKSSTGGAHDSRSGWDLKQAM